MTGGFVAIKGLYPKSFILVIKRQHNQNHLKQNKSPLEEKKIVKITIMLLKMLWKFLIFYISRFQELC